MKIVGVDHATFHAGIAVYENQPGKNVENGKFTVYQSINLHDYEVSPMLAMHEEVASYIGLYSPDFVALEKPMALRNGDIARKLIEVYAACKLAAEEAEIEVIEVSPQMAKIHTVGHGQAEKEDVALALQARFKLDFDEIAIPVFYKDKKRKGQIRDRLFDVSDSCALCIAAYEIAKAEKKAHAK